MSGKRINITVENRSIGYIEGTQAKIFQSLLAKVYLDGWPDLAESVPSSTTTGVYHLEKPEDCFYKEFYDRNVLDRIKAVINGGRCRRHIRQSILLVKNNFNSPELLATGKLEGKPFVISRSVAGTSFGEYMSALLRRPKAPIHLLWKRTLFSSVGTLVGRLHSAGIVHGDLRPNNILLEVVNSQPRWYFIDNERNKKHKKICRKDLIKNLIQINMFHSIDMSLSDRRRFFKAYFKAFQPTFDFRKMEAEVLKKVFLRLEKKPLVNPDYARIKKQAGTIPSKVIVDRKISE